MGKYSLNFIRSFRLAGIVLVWSGTAWAGDTSIDVADQVEILGTPLAARYPAGESIYARNVWDLCAFEGRVLIGGGNSSNLGPASNAGPVPLFSYSPADGRFRQEFAADDEQINVFRVLDGKLCVPGHDPKESWELGNYYRLEDGGWRKHRNIPLGIHNYDMAFFKGTLLAALGTEEGAAVATSRDMGATWTNVPAGDDRVYHFLTVQGELYSVGSFPRRPTRIPSSVVYIYDKEGGLRPRNDLDGRAMFPGVKLREDFDARIARPVSFNETAIYLGAHCHNDHQFMPFGVFVAESLKEGSVSVRAVPFPHARAWDLLCHEGEMFVLLDSPRLDGTIVRVATSRNGRDWTEVLHFRAKTFARSVAILDGDLYFGLGCEVNHPEKWDLSELPPETGQILRVKKQAWRGTSKLSS